MSATATGANLTSALGTRSTLCFGTDTAELISVGPVDGEVVVVEPAMCVWTQLTRRFDTVAIDCQAIDVEPPETCRAVLHAAVLHLAPGGRLVAAFDQNDRVRTQYVRMCSDFDLEPEIVGPDAGTLVVHRRAVRFSIHDLVFEARCRIRRMCAADLDSALSSSHPPTVVDTRSGIDRARFGVIRGSIHIPRTTLEWSCDGANGYRHPTITSADQFLVIVCNAGYSSSLAAATLGLLGFTNVADLIGGHQAWVRLGLAVEAPDHSSLDY